MPVNTDNNNREDYSVQSDPNIADIEQNIANKRPYTMNSTMRLITVSKIDDLGHIALEVIANNKNNADNLLTLADRSIAFIDLSDKVEDLSAHSDEVADLDDFVDLSDEVADLSAHDDFVDFSSDMIDLTVFEPFDVSDSVKSSLGLLNNSLIEVTKKFEMISASDKMENTNLEMRDVSEKMENASDKMESASEKMENTEKNLSTELVATSNVENVAAQAEQHKSRVKLKESNANSAIVVAIENKIKNAGLFVTKGVKEISEDAKGLYSFMGDQLKDLGKELHPDTISRLNNEIPQLIHGKDLSSLTKKELEEIANKVTEILLDCKEITPKEAEQFKKTFYSSLVIYHETNLSNKQEVKASDEKKDPATVQFINMHAELETAVRSKNTPAVRYLTKDLAAICKLQLASMINEQKSMEKANKERKQEKEKQEYLNLKHDIIAIDTDRWEQHLSLIKNLDLEYSIWINLIKPK